MFQDFFAIFQYSDFAIFQTRRRSKILDSTLSRSCWTVYLCTSTSSPRKKFALSVQKILTLVIPLLNRGAIAMASETDQHWLSPIPK